MAGIKGKSGRKPRRDEERALIGQYFEAAVSVVVEILSDIDTPKHIRLDAAKMLIEQHVGKAKQSISGEDGGPVLIRVIYDEEDDAL